MGADVVGAPNVIASMLFGYATARSCMPMPATPIMDRLTAEIERRDCEGRPAQRITLTSGYWYALRRELAPWLRINIGGDLCQFLNVPVQRLERYGCGCYFCGAPKEEGGRCRFCARHYEFIDIDGEILE